MINPTDIAILSNEPWGDVWYSKQHYANELSNLGHKVYFVNAPTHWSIKNLFDLSVSVRQVKESLWVIEYKNPFPVRVFPKLFMRLNDLICRWKIKRKIDLDKSIMWTFDPLRFIYSPLSKKIIYHVADPYMKLNATATFDPVIAAKASKIICTSPLYNDYYRSLGFENSLTVPHVVSEEERKADPQHAEKIKEQYGDFVLFIGTLNNRIDFSVFQNLSRDLPNTNIVIIGKDNPDLPLEQRIQLTKNLKYLGVVHGQKLKDYIVASKVCITAYTFDTEAKIGAGSPLKILNYISQFKPVISSINSEVDELNGQGIYLANDYSEFIEFVKKGLADELLVNKTAIEAYLEEKTYPKAIKQILNGL